MIRSDVLSTHPFLFTNNACQTARSKGRVAPIQVTFDALRRLPIPRSLQEYNYVSYMHVRICTFVRLSCSLCTTTLGSRNARCDGSGLLAEVLRVDSLPHIEPLLLLGRGELAWLLKRSSQHLSKSGPEDLDDEHCFPIRHEEAATVSIKNNDS